MKKIYAILIAVIATVQITFAQTTNYVAKFNSSSTPINSLIYDDGTGVGIGTTTPGAKLDVNGVIRSSISSGSNLVLSKSTGSSIEFNNGSGVTNALIEADNSSNRLEFWTNTAGNTGLVERMRIDNTGKIGIGTKSPDEQLTVKGKIHTEEVKVDLSVPFPDYVFKPSYKLRPLAEVKSYIDKNQHLPEMPTEAEVAKNGLNLGETNALLTKKVEELTLYLIEKDKQVNDLQSELAQLKTSVKQINKAVAKSKK